jgi:serine protease Do
MEKRRTAAFVGGLFALGLGCGLGLQAGRVPAHAQRTSALWTERGTGTNAGTAVAIPSLAELARQLQPSVANIHRSASGQMSGFLQFLERQFGSVPDDVFNMPLGTAFVIHSDGLLLTNAHVVEEAGEEIRVKLDDGTFHRAEIVGTDAPTDVALLRIRTARPLPAAPLGDSDRLQIGDWVVAIGNPFGLEHTVTAGIVSAKGRNTTDNVRPSGRVSQYYSFIQTDAAINPGNSGGPLFNLAGEVVGINSAVNTAGQGVGFAIPINMAKELLPALHGEGYVRRSRIGIGIQELTPELAESFGLGTTRGALINEVYPDTPAARAGLRVGDVVTKFGTREVPSSAAARWTSRCGAGVAR